jgi:hypothetical protein
MANVTIGQIIASNYIKYDRLAQMVTTAFANSNAEKVNLFIDINSCIKPMYASGFNLVSLEEDTAIAAYIINMIAHYRKYFKTRHSVSCDAYLVYSPNIRPEHLLFYSDYNKTMWNTIRLQKEKNDLLLINMAILEKLCPYLPDTCITMGTFETSVIMQNIINKVRNPNVPNVVISRDIYATQLPAVNPDVIVFRPKKSKQIDESYFVANGGCITNLINDRQVHSDASGLNDGLLSLIMALNKLPERDVKTLLSLPKALSLIKSAIETGRVYNNYSSNISDIINLFPDKEKTQCIHGGLDGRFKSIDLVYQSAIYEANPDRHNFKGIANLYDPRGIHSICNEYFKVNPLDLDNL